VLAGSDGPLVIMKKKQKRQVGQSETQGSETCSVGMLKQKKLRGTGSDIVVSGRSAQRSRGVEFGSASPLEQLDRNQDVGGTSSTVASRSRAKTEGIASPRVSSTPRSLQDLSDRLQRCKRQLQKVQDQVHTEEEQTRVLEQRLTAILSQLTATQDQLKDIQVQQRSKCSA